MALWLKLTISLLKSYSSCDAILFFNLLHILNIFFPSGATICPSNPALVIFSQYFIYCRNENLNWPVLKSSSGRWWSYELILLALNINYFKCHRRNKTIASPLPHVCLIFFWSPTPLAPPTKPPPPPAWENSRHFATPLLVPPTPGLISRRNYPVPDTETVWWKVVQ